MASAKPDMNTVTIRVATWDKTKAEVAAAFRGEKQGCFISFVSVELMWRVLTPRRWEILRAMAGQGPLTIRALAKRVGRDIKVVHGDVKALTLAGVIDKTKRGVEFPYDAIHVDFTVTPLEDKKAA